MISTLEQHSKLVYCSAAFKEAVRLKSALPFLFLQCTVRIHLYLDTGLDVSMVQTAANILQVEIDRVSWEW